MAGTEMSKRDRHVARLRERHPDKTFDNDEDIYGQTYDDYDEYERQIGGYREREKALGDMFAADPRSAEFLTEMSKGGNPVMALLKNFGPDIKETLDDPEKMRELADAWAKEQERLAKSRQLDDEYAKNMEESLETLRKYQEERGLGDDEADAIIFGLISIVRDGVMGKFTAETLDMMSKAINHDGDVAMAKDEGTVAGRNQRVVERLRKGTKGDGMPPLGGKNGRGGGDVRPRSIFDLANDAQ